MVQTASGVLLTHTTSYSDHLVITTGKNCYIEVGKTCTYFNRLVKLCRSHLEWLTALFCLVSHTLYK